MTGTIETKFRFAPLLAAAVATVLLLWLLGTAAGVFLVLFVAVIFALYLGALTEFLVSRLRVPRQLAFTAAVLATLGMIVGLCAVLVPPVIEQTQQLIRVLPTYISNWQSGLERLAVRYPTFGELIRPYTSDLSATIGPRIEAALGALVPKVFSLGHYLVNGVSILVMGIYLALHPGLYREWMIALFPPLHRDTARDVVADLGTTLRSWIVAQILAMSILAFLTAIGLRLLNVPYWLTFGVFTGAVAIVPFFGALISSLLPALFVLGGPGFGDLGPGMHAFLVLLLGVVIHVIEANFVIPLILSRRVEIPPVLSMMAILVSAQILGAIGPIVAVPLLTVVMVLVRDLLIKRVYEEPAFRRTARDRILTLRVPVPDGNVIVGPDPPVDVLRASSPAKAAARAAG